MMTPLPAHTRDGGRLELTSQTLDLCTTPCVRGLITWILRVFCKQGGF